LLGVLRGHLARANPQWRRAGAGSPALAIFLGPQAYVSPAWYPTKAETGKVVPTWNYLMVHARGEIRFIEDRAALLRHVGRLTQAHEASRALPWAMEDAPADYIETMLRGIVGFEIAIATIEGKWKMSQNRNAADRDGVVAGLEREAGAGGAAVAAVMAALKTDS
jgi:transcriptional regulator